MAPKNTAITASTRSWPTLRATTASSVVISVGIIGPSSRITRSIVCMPLGSDATLTANVIRPRPARAYG